MMPGQQTWDDLLIQGITQEETGLWLQEWSSVLEGHVGPIFMSKFGDWFLRRSKGSTDELSVIEGTLTTIAESSEEFAAQINSTEWQEEHLLSYHVYLLHQRGLVLGPRQCYAFAPHPLLTGKIDIDTVMVMDVIVWQSICAQTIGTQLREPE